MFGEVGLEASDLGGERFELFAAHRGLDLDRALIDTALAATPTQRGGDLRT
jgi:hypothetical protein